VKVISSRFLAWLMSLTTLMRYFVIALLLHVAFVVVLGSIKIVAVVPVIVAKFQGTPLPPPVDETLPDDPFAAYRDFDYDGPTLGGGGGLGGKGPGGVPTASGTRAGILATGAPTESPEVAEVIGVFSDSATAITRPAANPGGVGLSAMSGLGEVGAGTGGVRGPGGPWLGAGRIGPQRSVNLNKFGGSQRTERAVLAALRWLKENQQPDGSWPGTAKPAMAGLALLCFFGHGETSDSAEFGATIDKGLRYLVTTVKSDGTVGGMYEQGIVGIALAEAYTLTTSPLLREPLQRAIDAILKAQSVPKANPADKGGWRYTHTSNDADLSVSGWQVMALKSAKVAGIEVPDESMSNAVEYVWNCYGGPGFAYTGKGTAYAMTAVGTLCQFFLGNGHDKRIEKALDYLGETKVDWEKAGQPGSIGFTLYGWYYSALSIFQGQGSQWVSWNRQFQKELVDNQKDDGHWESPSERERDLGPVYSTALCTLMLEVYYRYLPMYQVEAAGQRTGPALNLPTIPPPGTQAGQ